MTWSTNKIEFEGLPLLLRKPDHKNIWHFKSNLSKLVSVEHLLDYSSNTGLPERNYNKTMSDFDRYMCDLFKESNMGIIFLIETFAGKRNYYYYTTPSFDITSMFEKIMNQFKVELTTWEMPDGEWDFLEKYPITIYTK